jgi:hypothetical protein
MHAKVGVADARDNGNFMMKSSTASVLSQLSKLVLGSACFVVVAAGAVGAANVGVNSAKKAIFSNTLSISPKLVSWASDIRPAFKTTTTNISLQSPLDAVAADSFSENVSSQIHQGLKRIAHLEKAQHLAMRRARTIRQPVVLARAKIVRDEVLVSQSSVEQAKPVIVLTEAEKLQAVQATLVSRFVLAMNDGPKANTQVAAVESLDTQAKIESVLKLIAPQAPKQAVVKSPVIEKKPEIVAEEDANDEEATAPSPAKKEIAPYTLSQTAPSQLQGPQKPNTGGVSTQQNVLMVTQPVASAKPYSPPSLPLVLRRMPTTPPATAPPTIHDDEQPAAKLVEEDARTANIARPQSAVVAMAQDASHLWGSGYPAQVPPTAKIEYSKPIAQNTHSQVTPTNQKAFEPTTHEEVLPPAPLVKSLSKPATAIVDKIGSSSSAPMIMSNPAAPPLKPSFGPLLDRTSRWAFHEAFDWNTSVIGPKVEVLSQEGAVPDQIQARGQSAGQTLGWRIAKANQHWATLFWSTPNQEEVPMLNALSAKMLSVKAAAALQTDAGIILAKVPAGWSLEFSGRSERPLIFDRTNHLLAPSATEGSNGGERYYVFLNASPGEQILYLNHAGGETGALAIPVLGGVMAYADLTQVEKRTISGRILEASESSPRGVAGIHVQVVGSGMSTVTNNSGDFHIDNVIAFGDQNLYIEAETQKSFPHRYKLSPSQTTHLSLFHLTEAQVHEWIGQLEGGVSSESGLILGALPTLSASQEDRKPLVGTRSLANGPTLTPETYTLSGSGQLMVKTPLNGVRSRFISVQVPEGPTLVEVVDKDNRLIWSEITVVSPRVLTIVGPY